MHIHILLDVSGSMQAKREEVVKMVNNIIHDDQYDASTTISLHLFNDKMRRIYKQIPIKEARDFTLEDYEPINSTKLYDALYYVLQKHYVKDMLLFVITDGADNSSNISKEYVEDILRRKKDVKLVCLVEDWVEWETLESSDYIPYVDIHTVSNTCNEISSQYQLTLDTVHG